MFKNSRTRSRRNRRHRRQDVQTTSYGSLEDRRLLAGNVTVANTDNLYIRGDSLDNQIEIIGNDDGSISVIGKNGTTVNGQATPLTIAGGEIDTQINGVRASYDFGLRANVGQGDDSLLIEGVEFKGSSIVYGGPGDDSVGAYQTNFRDRLLLQTFTGNDSVSLDTADVGKDLYILTLDGSDTIGIDTAQLEGDVFVVGGNGRDAIAVKDSTVLNELLVLSQNGNDYVSLENVLVGERTGVFGGDGNDDISLDYSNVAFVRNTIVGGQSNFDRFAINVPDVQRDGIELRTFELGGLEDDVARRKMVFDDLIVSGARLGTVTELAILTPDLSTLTGAVVATDLAGALNDTPNLTVFAPLNSAFDKLPDGTLESLTGEQLSNILLFHVLGESVFASELITRTEVETLLGPSFTVELNDDGVLLNDNVTLAATDIRAKNGVVHLVNEVLLPAS
ncbi:fasciclin domain-containing protein [Mariniblastus fucicola]|uniref:Cell surface lipoprotein MPB83 n=1 Tax=Mariniblastus fucicola TaxID=980251 RepID=A0A5B9P6E2_9BACT|nr:fasciclin domain-containing protein [Mariniblastus fucicola]QEG20745.1 Cell surface lipoprotein MPB83 precursor [Mariniblastus fucicola]